MAAPRESRSDIQIDDFQAAGRAFPAVFVHDRPTAGNQLNGPVFNAEGRVAGIHRVRARRHRTWWRQVADRLRKGP